MLQTYNADEILSFPVFRIGQIVTNLLVLIVIFQIECVEINPDNVGEGGSTAVSPNEHDEIIATEKVLNAMLFYRRYGITRIHMSITSFQYV